MEKCSLPVLEYCFTGHQTRLISFQLSTRVVEIASISAASPATVTTETPHCLKINDKITLQGILTCPESDGDYTVATVTGLNTFTVNLNASTHGETVSAGQVVIPEAIAGTVEAEASEIEPEKSYFFSGVEAIAQAGSNVIDVIAPPSGLDLSLGYFSSGQAGITGAKILNFAWECVRGVYHLYLTLSQVAPASVTARDALIWAETTGTTKGPQIGALPVNILDAARGIFTVNFSAVAEMYLAEIFLGSPTSDTLFFVKVENHG